MISWLQNWLLLDDTKIIYLLSLIFIASTFDLVVGWVNARFNPDVVFSSTKSGLGVAKKIIIFMLLVYFVPVAMLVPDPIGLSALYVLYTAYLLGEINSIFSHLGLTKDDKQGKLFIDFIQKLTNGKENETE